MVICDRSIATGPLRPAHPPRWLASNIESLVGSRMSMDFPSRPWESNISVLCTEGNTKHWGKFKQFLITNAIAKVECRNISKFPMRIANSNFLAIVRCMNKEKYTKRIVQKSYSAIPDRGRAGEFIIYQTLWLQTNSCEVSPVFLLSTFYLMSIEQSWEHIGSLSCRYILWGPRGNVHKTQVCSFTVTRQQTSLVESG